MINTNEWNKKMYILIIPTTTTTTNKVKWTQLENVYSYYWYQINNEQKRGHIWFIKKTNSHHTPFDN